MDYMEVESETFQHQALEIQQPGEDFDPNAEPQSGEEFLMHMLYERQRCPSIVVRRPKNIEIKNASTIVNEEKHTSSPTLLPTVEWKAAQEEIFQGKRVRVMQMRSALVANTYDNALEPPLTTESIEWLKFCQHHPPLLSTILRINQRNLETLLEFLSEWLNITSDDNEVETDDEANERNSKVHKLAVLNALFPPSADATNAMESESLAHNSLDLSTSEQWLGMWLYGVLVCLHLPLEPNVHSTLREIARACLRERSRLQSQELNKAVPYNLFIYLIAKVFGQLDFAEFV